MGIILGIHVFLLPFLQPTELAFVFPVETAFAGNTQFKLRSDFDDDDIVGIEIFVNGEHAHYFEEPPFSTEINMKAFPEGPVEVKAVLELYSGKTHQVRLDGHNYRPDIEENVTLIRVPVLAQVPSVKLQLAHFQLFEDGRPQKLQMMLGSEKPLYLLVLLDMSTSMEKRLILLRRGMNALMDRVRPGDILQVVGFNHRVFEVSEPETDMQKVRERLAGMEASGDTNIYGALWSGLKLLGRSNERRALVLFTDGDHTVLAKDDLYKKNLDDCIQLAREKGVPVYCIGFGVKVNRKKLEEISHTTGGKSFFKVAPKHLAIAFDSIGRELHHQYLLCYYTNASVGSHDIRVELKNEKELLLYPKKMYFGK